MAQLDLEIEASRGIIADLQRQLAQQKQRLRALELSVDNPGLDGEGGRAVRRAFEEEIARKRELVRSLEQLLEQELQRLRRLEEQLQRIRPRPPQIRQG
jgi:chromosome segregation ATPase